MSNIEGSKIANIPEQIIEKFLGQLAAEKTSPDIITRLRNVLLEKGDFSETALRSALTETPKQND